MPPPSTGKAGGWSGLEWGDKELRFGYAQFAMPVRNLSGAFDQKGGCQKNLEFGGESELEK